MEAVLRWSLRRHEGSTPSGIKNTRRTFRARAALLSLLVGVFLVVWAELVRQTRPLSAILRARNLGGTPTMDINQAGLAGICNEYLTPEESKMRISSLTRHLRNVVSNTDPIQSTELTRQRRKLGCAMVKQGVIPSPTSQDDLGHLGLVFINKYILAAKKRTGVYFHHLSKSGGSGFCLLAWLNGCRPPGEVLTKNEERYVDDVTERARGTNCWSYHFRDSFAWEPDRPTHGLNRSCGERLRFMSEVGLNFMANEGYMPEELSERPCAESGLLTTVILRHPLKRAISHLGHLLRPRQSHMEATTVCWPGGIPRDDQLHTVNISCLADIKHVISDNYQVRMMAGRPAYLRPRGGVSEEDLENAIATLHQYDVVDVLQSERAFPFEFGSTELLRVGLGFLLVDRPTNTENKGVPLELSDPLDTDHLQRMNANDAKLFKIGEEIVALDRAVYNRTYAYCAARLANVARELRAGCDALLETPIQLNSHPKDVLARQRKDKSPYSCGCGWAGSSGTNATFEPGMALLSKSVNQQACPREGLFDRRGVAEGINIIKP